jgi:hypothetical protein
MKNRWCFGVWFALATFFAGSANAESWIQLEHSKFLDQDSITRHDGLVGIWIKETDPRNQNGDRMWEAVLASYDIDCDRRTSAPTAHFFVQFNGTKTMGKLSNLGKQSPDPPGSLMDKARQLVCKKFYEVWK